MGPIFPYPDLPPGEVLTTSLPRDFNISSPDGTSPSQAPCPCVASGYHHARMAQKLWDGSHNLWESPSSGKGKEKGARAGAGEGGG
eukprot:1942196-Pyramimonas_sp.AAC.1